MVENVVRFVVLIGALVFVHELGHFAWAKLFGVKVLKFSLGFGPRLVGWRKGETDYCISLIPLGGFVKMLGEEPGDEVAPEDTQRAFNAQPIWKRFVIVLAGPVMSLVFPIALYFVVFLGRTDLTPPVIGTVAAGYPAEGRLLPGDRVTALDGEPITSFEELRSAIAASPARPIRFSVVRGEAPVEVTVTPESVHIDNPLDVDAVAGFLGIAPGFPLPVVGVRSPGTPASIAGLRTFDCVTMYAGTPIRRWADLTEALHRSRGSTVPLAFLRPQPLPPGSSGGLIDLEVFDPGLAQITPSPGTDEITARTGIESPDLYVSDVDPGSPEQQMGLRRTARVVSLDGVIPPSWERLRESLSLAPPRLRTLRFELQGREAVGGFTVSRAWFTDEFGQPLSRLHPAIHHWVPIDADPPIANPNPLRYAFGNALEHTTEAVGFLSTGLVRLLQGRVPVSAMGGPIMIYDVSRRTAADGLMTFLRLMALVSINLGLINLLPIPTLDGGHLAFLLAEAVLRRPAPLWVRQTASVIGLCLVGAVIIIAFRNDLARRFSADPAPSVTSSSPP